ncbi:hypothetical protein BKA67DRAFT_666191 [Truncatella angustata]|uniref:Rhodopsin domain-containing protein n=1 Tax=Truncatella angustata TaxID=152316 RepID=A0A9P8UVN2_9PEZI|nr:uncharacterized protein BKA67DRAFT_666191 [Truncatella angustata]KAH6659351.1 hypothetical protein BKA67DRAFT_666191 [Truncatella angustata]
MAPLSYLSDSDVALTTVACTCVFGLVAIVAMVVHVFTKCFVLRCGFRFDDYLLLAAFVTSLALAGQIIWAVVDENQGQHISKVTSSQFNKMAQSLLVSEVLWTFVNTLIRVSALLYLHNIFFPSKEVRYCAIGLCVVTVLYGMISLLTTVLICRPIQASWESGISGTCGNQTAAYVSLESIGLCIDILILVLPVQRILSLSLTTKRKAAILSVFSAGGIVTFVTALRIAALHRVNSLDFSYNQGYLGLLSTLGVLLSIIGCCAPSSAKLLSTISCCAPFNTAFRRTSDRKRSRKLDRIAKYVRSDRTQTTRAMFRIRDGQHDLDYTSVLPRSMHISQPISPQVRQSDFTILDTQSDVTLSSTLPKFESKESVELVEGRDQEIGVHDRGLCPEDAPLSLRQLLNFDMHEATVRSSRHFDLLSVAEVWCKNDYQAPKRRSHSEGENITHSQDKQSPNQPVCSKPIVSIEDEK